MEIIGLSGSGFDGIQHAGHTLLSISVVATSKLSEKSSELAEYRQKAPAPIAPAQLAWPLHLILDTRLDA
jgi:hypothetical protein